MFFDDPAAAFANIRRATRPGATMTFVCWRSREEDPVFTHGAEILAAALADPPTATPLGAPGPTAFADPDRLRGILDSARWGEIAVEPVDFDLDDGVDGSDGGATSSQHYCSNWGHFSLAHSRLGGLGAVAGGSRSGAAS